MGPDCGTVSVLQKSGLVPLGRMATRSAKEIVDSPWCIGCETLDRDYVDFAQVKRHLGELGATQVRLQAGWAKCDRGDGKYNWAWLDAVVDECLAQGVRPWLETSYGNPAYPGGGGTGLGDGVPHSEEALAAWDRWVRALVERYKDRAYAWEIWNEPDVHSAVKVQDYTALFIRTASIIREVDAGARVFGLALAGNVGFAEEFLKELAAMGKTGLLSDITFHMYPHNPDDSFDAVERLRGLVQRYAPHVQLRQGETGAPSETQPILALRGHPWNARKQAAWDLRRMLAHHARGIPMSLFQLADMYYRNAVGAKAEGRNTKGLLEIREDKTVAHRKAAYFAAQHVFTLLDGKYPVRELENLAQGASVRTYAYAWKRHGAERPDVVAWWRGDEPPGLDGGALTTIALPPQDLREPVLLDLMSGFVFSGELDWSAMPCADSPLALVEQSAISLRHNGAV